MTDQDKASRVRIIINLSSKSENFPQACRELAQKISARYAGCFLRSGEGFWSTDGASDLAAYPEESIISEPSALIEVSVLLDEKDAAIAMFKTLCADVDKKFDLAISWIHVETLATHAYHFKL
jgi:hypothetical protein